MRAVAVLLAVVLGAACAAAAPATSPATELYVRQDDSNISACDKDANALKTKKTTTIPIKAIAGGTGTCNVPYDTQKNSAVCVSPGWVDKAQQSRCGDLIRASYNGKEVVAKVVDTCNGDPGSPFTCDDAWFTIKAFKVLADDDEWAQGHLNGKVTWHFESTDSTPSSANSSPSSADADQSSS